MKILFLNQFFRPDPAATGQLVADVAEALARRGHEVHVVCSRRPYGGGRAPQAAEELHGDVKVHRVGASGFGRGNILGRAVDYLSFYVRAWRRAMALPRMDVCVALTTPPFIAEVAVSMARRRRTALVHWVMDLYPEILAAYGMLGQSSIVYRLAAWASRRTYRCAASIISLGEVMTQCLVESGAPVAKITTIHNWVPGEVVHSMAPARSTTRRAWCREGEVSVMYSGNLGLGHDLKSVLRAAGRLAAEYPLRVLLVGHGRMRRELESVRDRRHLDCVDFHEPRPLEDISDSLAAGDIHIISQREGTQGLLVPSKLYGVLAAGRPSIFIGPEDTEVADILRCSGAGLVVPPGDVTAVAEAIKVLLDGRALREAMGAKARAWYEKNLGLERSVRQLVHVIESATEHR